MTTMRNVKQGEALAILIEEVKTKKPKEKVKPDKEVLAALEDAPFLNHDEARDDPRWEESPPEAAQRRFHRQKLMRRARLFTNLLKSSDQAGKDKDGADQSRSCTDDAEAL